MINTNGMSNERKAGLIYDIAEDRQLSSAMKRTYIEPLVKELGSGQQGGGRVGPLYLGPIITGTGGSKYIRIMVNDSSRTGVDVTVLPQPLSSVATSSIVQRITHAVIHTNESEPAVKICSSCPSFIGSMDHAKQRNKIGKIVDLDWCAATKVPLGTWNSTTKQINQIQRAQAKDCSLYGATAIPGDGAAIASVPLGVVKGTFDSPADDDEERPESCSACRFHVSQSVMLTQLGIPLAGCVRRGDAILPGQEAAAARDCKLGVVDHAAAQSHTANMNGFTGHGAYAGNFTLITIDATTGETTTAPAPEPTEYTTDAKLSAEDEAAGIRAWRKIEDPDGTGNSVLMPIFDPARFDDVERVKIPQTGDDEHPELYVDHQGLAYKMTVLWRHMNETPALNGVPGVGKTEAFRYLAWMMQLPFERISITGSTEVDDLQGRTVLEAGETRFQYGRVPAAWQRPCVMVIDEPNVGPPEVWQFLRPLTDNSKQLVVDANKGERIARNSFCFLGMAFNPSWDMRNVGTHEISDADGSRLMHIAVPEPSEELERKILAERCRADGYALPREKLDSIIKIAADIRALAKQDAFPIHWGTRQQIKVARASQWFTLHQAYRLAAGDLIDPEANEQLSTIVKSHVSSGNAKDSNKISASKARKPF